MAIMVERARVELQVSLLLSEAEARALATLTEYGISNIAKGVHDVTGDTYIKNHGEGLKLLLQSAGEHLPAILRRTDEAREVFVGTKTAHPRPLAQ